MRVVVAAFLALIMGLLAFVYFGFYWIQVPINRNQCKAYAAQGLQTRFVVEGWDNADCFVNYGDGAWVLVAR